MRPSWRRAIVKSMIELDTVTDDWQFALDAAGRALTAAARDLPADELHARRQRLAAERIETERDLEALAARTGATHHPWLAPFPLRPSLLGVVDSTTACIFDLEGVLTDGGAVHAAAWADVFDDLLLRLSAVDGAYALARRKHEALGRHMRERGVNVLPGARAYLEAAGRAHLGRAVVSSSTRTLPMLELAGLASLVDTRVDAEQIAAGALRSRPAPDLLVRACELLEVEPRDAVSFAHTPAGVAAARAAGVRVVAARLVDLLDGRLAALAA